MLMDTGKGERRHEPMSLCHDHKFASRTIVMFDAVSNTCSLCFSRDEYSCIVDLILLISGILSVLVVRWR